MTLRNERSGFTLIELIIVFTLIGILVGLALPQFKHAAQKARESTLKESLFTMRKLIDQYYTDKAKYPASLQALVQDSYLRTMPVDPMTLSSETWVEVRELPSPEDPLMNEVPGVIDVKSGSDRKSPVHGTPYNTW